MGLNWKHFLAMAAIIVPPAVESWLATVTCNLARPFTGCHINIGLFIVGAVVFVAGLVYLAQSLFWSDAGED